jgi:hypothetical protein
VAAIAATSPTPHLICAPRSGARGSEEIPGMTHAITLLDSLCYHSTIMIHLIESSYHL